MQIRNYQFKPGLLAIVATVIAVSVFSYLAVWQLGRAEERKYLRDEIMQRLSQPVSEFAALAIELESDRYKRYRLEGEFLNTHQVLLDNVVRHGQAGYEVITPFKNANGGIILVNRGWLAAGNDRRVLPDIQVGTQQQQIVVSLDKPRSAPVVGARPVESGNRWNYLDIEFYRQQTGLSVPDYLLLLSPDSGSGYERSLPEVEDKSGMHIGYAIQWGAFALIALGTFLGLNIKRANS